MKSLPNIDLTISRLLRPALIPALLIVVTLAGPGGYAQKLNITLTGKQVKKLEKIAVPAKKLQKYRKLYRKDSARYMRERDKLYKKKKDSLHKALKRYARTGLMDTLQLPQEYRQYLTRSLFDSSVLVNKGKAWLVAEGKSLLAGNKTYQAYRQMLDENPEIAGWIARYGNDPAALAQMPDSLFTGSYFDKAVEARLAALPEFREFKTQTMQFDALAKLPGQYKARQQAYLVQAKNYADKEKWQQQAKTRARTEVVQYTRKFLAENSKLLGRLEKEMAGLKKKYASFKQNADLTTAVKRNSLRGRPVGERLVAGGNFDIQVGTPVRVDLSPLLGFRFNKKFTLGAGGTYRFEFSKDSLVNNRFNKQVYGANAFVSYEVAGRFFIYGQADYLTEQNKTEQPNPVPPVWRPGVMAGIGRAFRVAPKLTGTVILLYTVVENEIKNPAGNRWQVKFGFQTNELSFKKIPKPF